MMLLRGFRGLGAGCPQVPGMPGKCLYGDMIIDCALIRECDSITGAEHFEYVIGNGESVNPNIWRWNSGATGGTGAGNWLWSTASGSQAAPPEWTQPALVNGAPQIDYSGVQTSNWANWPGTPGASTRPPSTSTAVTPAPAATPAATGTPSGIPAANGGGPGGTATIESILIDESSGVPWWVWAGGAAALLVMTMGGKN